MVPWVKWSESGIRLMGALRNDALRGWGSMVRLSSNRSVRTVGYKTGSRSGCAQFVEPGSRPSLADP
jgi:hypothetical protein